MWKSLWSKAVWLGAKPPGTQPASTRAVINGHERILRSPVSARPPDREEPEVLPVAAWLAARRLAGGDKENFPIEFWLAARRLVRDPIGRSIHVDACIRYFGDTLLRYVPTPKADLLPLRGLNASSDKHSRWDGFIDGCDWSSDTLPLSRFIQFELIEDISRGLNYKDAPSYQKMLHMMRDGTLDNNNLILDNQEKVDRYCDYVQWLVESIRTNGLRRRAENRHEHAFADIRVPSKEAREKDVRVAVNAQGEFLRFGSGRHRVAVAQVLGIEEVPAQVRLVHVGWLKHLTEASGLPPHAALRKWLRSFRAAVKE